MPVSLPDWHFFMIAWICKLAVGRTLAQQMRLKVYFCCKVPQQQGTLS